MTISESKCINTEILVRKEVVEVIRNEVIRLLNELDKKFDFNRVEVLMAFNEVMLIEWDAHKYLSSLR